ncbi:transposase [Moorena producens JHB]|uniref:Transposase n=1 Tax=Moorena producens (strain JHB) TaxID=1454205 RepID=A0A1D9G2A7_MOOP1|nr:transposase [Moorena producens]AOY81762.1 transposase [Moorena producens JHB]
MLLVTLVTCVEVPDNIILFFQPPYCPEVNQAERLWEYLKQELAWELFESLDSLRAKIAVRPRSGFPT